MSLSEKQRRFVAEYLLDLNATQAAMRAGYSRKTANQQGPRLLVNAGIKAAVQAGQRKKLSKLEITAERVLGELARLAFLDPRKLFREDGTLKGVGELDGDTAAAVAAFDFEKLYEHYAKGRARPVGTVAKIRFADKGANLERLGRHLKLFTDRLDIRGQITLEEVLAARRRAGQ